METQPNLSVLTINLPTREPITLTLKEARKVFDELWHWLEKHIDEPSEPKSIQPSQP